MRSYFQKFIIFDKFQALFHSHHHWRHQPQSFIGTRSPGIGQVLFLADVYGYVLAAGILAHYHALIYFCPWFYKEAAPFLGIVQPIGHGSAGFGCHQGTPFLPGISPR